MSAPRVKIYTTMICGFCRAARRLLEAREVPFEEVDMTGKPAELRALKRAVGHRTVPIVLIDDELIGGYMELAALIRARGAESLMP